MFNATQKYIAKINLFPFGDIVPMYVGILQHSFSVSYTDIDLC